MKQDIHIPDNIAKWIAEHDGVNLSINFNSASGNSGYAHVIWLTAQISILTRTCNRCGYDRLWKPDDTESKCLRHTYNAWRYDTVFTWGESQNQTTLEDAFNTWLAAQSDKYDKPIVMMSFGKLGWK